MSRSPGQSGDVLREIDQAALQTLLVACYRDLGWWVEPAAGDAGIDDGVRVLKRDRDVILLDCRHWGRESRPQDAVSSLIRDLERAGATGAILVDRRTFSRVDHDAAHRHGHVRLIDPDGLRGMLGDVSERRDGADPPAPPLPVPEVSRTHPRAARRARKGHRVWWLIAALACLVVFVLLVRALLARTADTALPPDAPRPAAVESSSRPAVVRAGHDARVRQVEIDRVHVSAMRPSPGAAAAPLDADAIDVDERSEEAMRLIEATTPEM